MLPPLVLLLEDCPHSLGQDDSRGDIISVAEPAGDGHNLKIIQKPRPLDQGVDVHQRGPGPGQLPAVHDLLVAVDPRGPQNQYAYLSHSK